MLKSFLVFVLLSGSPLNQAMDSCESPSSLRAAFTVEVKSDGISQICQYDPRPNSLKAFTCSIPAQSSDLLDDTIALWSDAPHPDNWLFANGIKQYFLSGHDIDDLGAAWRVRFSPNTLDASGETTISKGEAWLLPDEGRFLKVSYVMRPTQDPTTKIERNLMFDRVEGTKFSYVHTFEEEIETLDPTQGTQSWSAKVLDVQFFYADFADPAT